MIPFHSDRRDSRTLAVHTRTYIYTLSCVHIRASRRARGCFPTCRWPRAAYAYIYRVFGEPLYKRKLGDILSKEKVDKYFFLSRRNWQSFKIILFKVCYVLSNIDCRGILQIFVKLYDQERQIKKNGISVKLWKILWIKSSEIIKKK